MSDVPISFERFLAKKGGAPLQWMFTYASMHLYWHADAFNVFDMMLQARLAVFERAWLADAIPDVTLAEADPDLQRVIYYALRHLFEDDDHAEADRYLQRMVLVRQINYNLDRAFARMSFADDDNEDDGGLPTDSRNNDGIDDPVSSIRHLFQEKEEQAASDGTNDGKDEDGVAEARSGGAEGARG